MLKPATTGDSDPAVVERATTLLPGDMGLPFTSFNCTVMVVEAPPLAIEFEAAVMVDVKSEGVDEVGLAIR